MSECSDKFYPNCNSSVWLRSCETEVAKPLPGKIIGTMPTWLRGSLLRNGPGSLKVGSMRFEHLFDSSALVHRFSILDGTVTYQCRFIRTNTFKKNKAADRIVVTEFGTKAVPDPCHTIFDRVASIFKPVELSDNTMISLYPFGDDIYTFTEGPFIHRIDPKTLDTLERKDMMKCVALVNHTSHPHVMPNGDVINVGMSVIKGRIRHVVVKFPYTEKGDMFERAHIVGSMKPRWSLHPAYMHTFGITENYYVIIEQPLTISVFGVVRNQLANKPLASNLQWYSEHKVIPIFDLNGNRIEDLRCRRECLGDCVMRLSRILQTNIVLISKKTGKESKRYVTETIFFLHIINAFEQNGKLIVDLCAYKDAKAIDAMYIRAIETMQSNADYAEWFRGRPKRLEVSLDAPSMSMVEARILADVGCETPRIYYDLYNGRPYRYFYAISSDVDAKNPGSIIKVDTWTGEIRTWFDHDCYPSEPVFVPEPNSKMEDGGVLLSALVWGLRECSVGLLVLDARTLEVIARVDFETPSPAPKCLHGWFLPERT